MRDQLSWDEHLPYKQGVGSSNLSSRTKQVRDFPESHQKSRTGDDLPPNCRSQQIFVGSEMTLASFKCYRNEMCGSRNLNLAICVSNSVWEKAWRRAWQSLVRIQPCAVAKLIIRIIRDEEETGRENLYKNRCLSGLIAQLWESTCLASKRSRVRLPLGPP